MPKKKQSLTLLEVILTLSLGGMLISGLLFFYVKISRKSIEVKELRQSVLPIEVMRQRFNHLFAQVELVERPRLFATQSHPDAKGPTLQFFYEYGIDPNPLFCGPVKGMLYLNERDQLCLVTWAGAEARQEVFLEGVDTLSFSFFDPQKKQWKSSWDKKDPPPPFFQLQWKMRNDPKTSDSCAFFFPNAEAKIVYEKVHR